jgi:hypothetical protein
LNDPIETSTPSMVLTVKSCALPLTLPPPPPKKARVVVVVVVVVAEASVAPAKAVAASARRARGVVPANAEDVDATPRAPRAALARHETVARARGRRGHRHHRFVRSRGRSACVPLARRRVRGMRGVWSRALSLGDVRYLTRGQRADAALMADR